MRHAYATKKCADAYCPTSDLFGYKKRLVGVIVQLQKFTSFSDPLGSYPLDSPSSKYQSAVTPMPDTSPMYQRWQDFHATAHNLYTTAAPSGIPSWVAAYRSITTSWGKKNLPCQPSSIWLAKLSDSSGPPVGSQKYLWPSRGGINHLPSYRFALPAVVTPSVAILAQALQYKPFVALLIPLCASSLTAVSMGWGSDGKGKNGGKGKDAGKGYWQGGYNQNQNQSWSGDSSSGGGAGGYLATALTRERERAMALENRFEKVDAAAQEDQAQIAMKVSITEALKDSFGLGDAKSKKKANKEKNPFFGALKKYFTKDK